MSVADRWFKFFWIKFKKSPAVVAMKDYQRFWYIALIAESMYSERPGYIPNDFAALFVLSCCTASRHFFDEKWGCVREQFQESEDGKWLYNPVALQLAQEACSHAEKRVETEDELETLFLSSSITSFDSFEVVIERLFAFYRELFQRDGRYKLTPARKKKCLARLHEFMEAGGPETSVEMAEAASREAMRKLRESDFHWNHGYFDWIDHVFKSREVFEKRLAMKVCNDGKQTKNDEAERAIAQAAAGVCGRHAY